MIIKRVAYVTRGNLQRGSFFLLIKKVERLPFARNTYIE